MTTKLLNEKEDINEQTQFLQNTPLHLAVINNHYLEVKLLIKEGCDPNIGNRIGNEESLLPFQYAFLIGETIEKYISIPENREKDNIDLRLIAEDFGINESMICSKNWNLKLWKAIDFNRKIVNLFEEIGQGIRENDDEGEEGEEGEEGKNEEIKENEEDDNDNNAEDERNNNIENNAEDNNVEEMEK